MVEGPEMADVVGGRTEGKGNRRGGYGMGIPTCDHRSEQRCHERSIDASHAVVSNWVTQLMQHQQQTDCRVQRNMKDLRYVQRSFCLQNL